MEHYPLTGLPYPLNHFDSTPNEIISKIFVSLWELSTTAPSRHKIPAPLMSVCHRWRDVALYTPNLWTDVIINTQSIKQDNYDSLFSPVNNRLQRSGNLPLDVQGFIGDHNAFILLELVAKQSHRWRTCNLNFETDGPLVYLPKYTPQLTELRLTGPKFHWTSRPAHSPIPQSTVLTKISFTHVLRPDVIPTFAGIKDLRITDISSLILTTDYLVSILSNSPTLEILHLRGMVIKESKSREADNGGLPQRSIPPQLEHLRELRLLDLRCQEMLLILKMVDSRSLQRLEMEGVSQDPQAWPELGTAARELTFHFPLLERLAVRNLPNHDALLTDLYCMAPNISYFSFANRNPLKAIRDLTSPDLHLFPQLRTLTTRKITLNSLFDIVRLRQKSEICIRRLNIHITDIGLAMPGGLSDIPPPFTDFEETMIALQRLVQVEFHGELDWEHREIYRCWDDVMHNRKVTVADITIHNDNDRLGDSFAIYTL